MLDVDNLLVVQIQGRIFAFFVMETSCSDDSEVVRLRLREDRGRVVNADCVSGIGQVMTGFSCNLALS